MGTALALPSTSSAQLPPPPTLTGESFHTETPTITSVDCTSAANYAISYSASGTATGPYPGTFSETGTVISNQLSASFTLNSPVGQVGGSKTANVGAPVARCSENIICTGASCLTALAAFNTDRSGFAGSDTYQARITAATDVFTDNGLFSAELYHSNRIGTPIPINFFNEGFQSLLGAPVAVMPTTKDQCKGDGWEQFGFKNQGQCIAFVERGP